LDDLLGLFCDIYLKLVAFWHLVDHLMRKVSHRDKAYDSLTKTDSTLEDSKALISM